MSMRIFFSVFFLAAALGASSCSTIYVPPGSGYPADFEFPPIDEEDLEPVIEGVNLWYYRSRGRYVFDVGSVAENAWQLVLQPLLEELPIDDRERVLVAFLKHAMSYDEFDQVLRFWPRPAGVAMRSSSIGLVGHIASDGSWHAVVELEYYGRGWLFIDRMRLLLGTTEVLDVNLEDVEQKTSHGGWVIERFSMPAGTSAGQVLIESVSDLEQSLQVRFQGGRYHQDFAPSRKQRRDLKDLYEALATVRSNVERTPD